MKFYVGIHQPSDARYFRRAFMSINRLKDRVSDFPANDWIMDSGAFTQVVNHGRFTMSTCEYARHIRRWSGVGNLIAAVQQDYMCEPPALNATGADVETHQRWTIEAYDALTDALGSEASLVMPVLQGATSQDYARHLEAFGSRLAEGAYVGVGSVCKRQGRADVIASILDAILEVRPDLRLHAFGLKISSLGEGAVRDRLHSADSMAWSWHERKQGRSANHWSGAERFRLRVEGMPVQGSLLAAPPSIG